MGMSLHRATATALLVIVINSAAAFIPRAGQALDGQAVVVVAAAVLVTSAVSARWSNRWSEKSLGVGFAALVLNNGRTNRGPGRFRRRGGQLPAVLASQVRLCGAGDQSARRRPAGYLLIRSNAGTIGLFRHSARCVGDVGGRLANRDRGVRRLFHRGRGRPDPQCDGMGCGAVCRESSQPCAPTPAALVCTPPGCRLLPLAASPPPPGSHRTDLGPRRTCGTRITLQGCWCAIPPAMPESASRVMLTATGAPSTRRPSGSAAWWLPGSSWPSASPRLLADCRLGRVRPAEPEPG